MAGKGLLSLCHSQSQRIWNSRGTHPASSVLWEQLPGVVPFWSPCGPFPRRVSSASSRDHREDAFPESRLGDGSGTPRTFSGAQASRARVSATAPGWGSRVSCSAREPGNFSSSILLMRTHAHTLTHTHTLKHYTLTYTHS